MSEENFATRLKWLRHNHLRLTLKAFAERIGSGQGYIHELESGKKAHPSRAFVAKIARVFGVSSVWLSEAIGKPFAVTPQFHTLDDQEIDPLDVGLDPSYQTHHRHFATEKLLSAFRHLAKLAISASSDTLDEYQLVFEGLAKLIHELERRARLGPSYQPQPPADLRIQSSHNVVANMEAMVKAHDPALAESDAVEPPPGMTREQAEASGLVLQPLSPADDIVSKIGASLAGVTRDEFMEQAIEHTLMHEFPQEAEAILRERERRTSKRSKADKNAADGKTALDNVTNERTFDGVTTDSLKSWNDLRAELQEFTQQRGAKAQLARELGVPRQRLNDWINRGRKPDADITLRLVNIMLQAEAQKQTGPGGTSYTAGAKAQIKPSSSHDKSKLGPTPK